jgi:hypothetical protein
MGFKDGFKANLLTTFLVTPVIYWWVLLLVFILVFILVMIVNYTINPGGIVIKNNLSADAALMGFFAALVAWIICAIPNLRIDYIDNQKYGDPSR